jgi:hypothetical protein
MVARITRIDLRADELAGYRAAVIATSRGDERDLCERLLGQLASLETRALDADPGMRFSFAPSPGGADLAERALEHLHAKPLRRRFTREHERAPRTAVRGSYR